MPYEHRFVKKCDGHKVSKVACEVEFRSIFHAPSRKFKILGIPNVLAQGKLYEHGLMKKGDDHKLCLKSGAKSSFDQFFAHHL
ncbi:hypothetical protein BHM03_00044082 [Ensete ventricosum]|nr:hypothetical protein BHM03_00044082 [Ensete ventricosum]